MLLREQFKTSLHAKYNIRNILFLAAIISCSSPVVSFVQGIPFPLNKLSAENYKIHYSVFTEDFFC